MVSSLQIYSSYTNEDIALLQSFVVQDALLGDDFFVDGFSQKALLKSVPLCQSFNIERLRLPVSDDGHHAEALEYIAICDSSHRSTGSYCIVEIGAEWGLWISLGGVLTGDRWIKPIRLVGVESNPECFSLLKKQLSAPNMHIKVIATSADARLILFDIISILFRKNLSCTGKTYGKPQ